MHNSSSHCKLLWGLMDASLCHRRRSSEVNKKNVRVYRQLTAFTRYSERASCGWRRNNTLWCVCGADKHYREEEEILEEGWDGCNLSRVVIGGGNWGKCCGGFRVVFFFAGLQGRWLRRRELTSFRCCAKFEIIRKEKKLEVLFCSRLIFQHFQAAQKYLD